MRHKSVILCLVPLLAIMLSGCSQQPQFIGCALPKFQENNKESITPELITHKTQTREGIREVK